MVLVTQGEYTKNHGIIHFKRVNFMVCELSPNLKKKERSDLGNFFFGILHVVFFFFFKELHSKRSQNSCEKTAASLHKGKMRTVYKSQALLGKPAASLLLSSFVIV